MTDGIAPREHEGEHEVSWPRAIVATLVILVAGIGALVYGSNAVLTRAQRLTRHAQVAIVTTGFFVLLVALAWALRRLQRRNMI
jgi:hypothetical protein